MADEALSQRTYSYLCFTRIFKDRFKEQVGCISHEAHRRLSILLLSCVFSVHSSCYFIFIFSVSESQQRFLHSWMEG